MSYSAPGGGLKTKKYTITSADLLNALVIGPLTSPNAVYYLESDANYNGNFAVETLAQDGSWQAFDTKPTLSHNKAASMVYTAINQVNGSVSANQYPVQFRVRITLQATLGTCKVQIDYV